MAGTHRPDRGRSNAGPLLSGWELNPVHVLLDPGHPPPQETLAGQGRRCRVPVDSDHYRLRDAHLSYKQEAPVQQPLPGELDWDRLPSASANGALCT